MKKAAWLIVFASAMLPLAGVCDTAAERERRTDEIAAWLQDEPRADGARWSDRAAWTPSGGGGRRVARDFPLRGERRDGC